MDKHLYPPREARRGGGGGGRANLASCAVAAAFLALVAAALVIVFFVLFRPREPAIEVDAVQLPGFSFANGTASFTFAQYAAVRNPNRAAFAHFDSTLQLVSAGSQAGFMFIPAGEIAAGRTQYMAASFAVHSLPLPAAGGGGPGVEMESRMRLTGSVRVLKFFTHHVEATAWCRVGVSAVNGAVLELRC